MLGLAFVDKAMMTVGNPTRREDLHYLCRMAVEGGTMTIDNFERKFEWIEWAAGNRMLVGPVFL